MNAVPFPILMALLAWALATAPAASAADGEPPALMLANVYRGQVKLEDYWVSEKLDGVRAYWNGQQLISRQGYAFSPPIWFTRNFPTTPLDGELWMGRGSFEALSATVRQSQADDAQWRRIRYRVFDAPAQPGNFNARLEFLRQLLRTPPSPYLSLIEQSKVATAAELETRLQQVVHAGGEGLMLHRGDSPYRGLRSDDLLKVKTYEDAEARVIAYVPGKGKYQGQLGALLVESPGGAQFRLGTGFTDEERRQPPPIGSWVTYKYFGKTRKGLPRFASFLRIRELPASP